MRANGLDDWREIGLRASNPRQLAMKHIRLMELDQRWVHRTVRRALTKYRHRSLTERAGMASRMANRYGVYRGVVQRLPSRKLPELFEGYLAMIPTRLQW